MIKEEVKLLISKEIEWCKNNSGASERGEVFEQGFMAGLEQVIHLIERHYRGDNLCYPLQSMKQSK